MDITFKTIEGRFNYRVCAIIIQDGKILAMHDERSPYFYLPGGRVKLHETAESAILRELREELKIDAKMIRPLWMNQGFFIEDVTKEKFHEICIYFLIDISNTAIALKGNKFILYDEHHTLEFEWLEFNRLKNEYFYPEFLKESIFHLPSELVLMVEYEQH